MTVNELHGDCVFLPSTKSDNAPTLVNSVLVSVTTFAQCGTTMGPFWNHAGSKLDYTEHTARFRTKLGHDKNMEKIMDIFFHALNAY